jgi:hypothetical protein
LQAVEVVVVQVIVSEAPVGVPVAIEPQLDF